MYFRSFRNRLKRALSAIVSSSAYGADGRRHGLEDGPPLADLPLEGRGVERVRHATQDRPEGRITLFRPVMSDGTEPPDESIALVSPIRPRQWSEGAAPHQVQFETDSGATRAQIKLPVTASIYGTGEVAGPLLRTGRTTVFWNTDAWRFGDASPSLYQSHPYALAVLPTGRAIGILADCTWRGAATLAHDGVEFQFEGGPFDVYVLEGPGPMAVQRLLAHLIGLPPMPPRFALGYHQCRWSYMSEKEVREIARNFRKREIPCDVLWLDIDYMDSYRPFSWDKKRFPDPWSLTSDLHDIGFRTIAMLDPGLAASRDDPVSASGLDGDHFVRTRDGAPFVGKVWPGDCHFPDFTREATQSWWAGNVERFVTDAGLDGLWNDMNEPSVFRVPTKTMPDDAHHEGFGGGPHRRFHNVYGMLMSKASRQGLEAAHPGRRPFVVTRSSFLGGGRYAATWTGDNQATWTDLRWSISMSLNLGLSGQPFSGPDIGGFDGDPTPELFIRWFELGAFLPFARGHGEKGSCRKEPWSFGRTAEGHVRNALALRMRLLPYLYTLFREASTDGLPVMRPLFFADPVDPALRAIDDAFLLGSDLLVAPIVEPDSQERLVHLPKGSWYRYPQGGGLLGDRVTVDAPVGETPVFARAGAVIPHGPPIPSTARWDDSLELAVFLDADGEAAGRLYEDHGDGHGAYRESRFKVRRDGQTLRLKTDVTGEFVPDRQRVTLQVYGPWAETLALEAPTGAEVTITLPELT